jgi:HTH-type transcriptional regulator / antitoxin HipB
MHPINTATQIGAILAGRRKTLNLTQEQVSSRLGLSQNRLSVLEARPETLTVEQLIALLNVLGLEMRIDERSTAKPKVDW